MSFLHLRGSGLRLALALLCAPALAAGCSGGSSSTPVQPIAPIVASPTPTATPNSPLNVAPTTLTFINTGAGSAQTTTATENNYSGTFTAGTGCGSVVAISTASPAGVFTVTPETAGTCGFTVSDTNGQSVTVNVTVTLSSGVVKAHGRGAGQ